MKPERFSVELNLEESGVLCHLLLAELAKSNRIDDPIITRMGQLYAKLAHANNVLMGKVP
jgi:hypothetical protein